MTPKQPAQSLAPGHFDHVQVPFLRNDSRGGFAFPAMAHRITNTDGLCPACTDKEKEREKEKERAKEQDQNKDKDDEKEKPKPST
ncbi:hypothetical protein NM208_g2246 [Fusarium decemcellulare]|uniref:Uncharacterized protein n=1 Tax=Fusarium decemcellulare TaxID=57161 RepID=A0ACC1STF5_9HYPO|nr:hypothetical protein NM208_g2246 [Fusarium decemcellulare]